MCGIVGIVGREPVNQALYDALTVLQHRGQDAAGIVTSDERVHIRKKNGLVRDVFQQRHMVKLTGNMGIGHVRYPTAGCSSRDEAQPFYVNSPYGICLGHNGNLTNAEELTKTVVRADRRHLNTTSDTEVLLNVFAHELAQLGNDVADAPSIFDAVQALHRRVRGGYAVVAMILHGGIVGFRDPHGIRPLVIGRRATPAGEEYIIASESVALDALGFDLIRDVEPGEAVFIDVNGRLHTRQCVDHVRHSPCIFEFVYFARPDSIIDNISVYKARLRMGEALADRILSLRPKHDIDVVIPIPDTSRTSALQLANRLGLKYREGFIKNRYIGRTFIMPGQSMREKSVRRKLNAIDLEFRKKNVLLVDDSIVRGTTSRQIIDMAREAGARGRGEKSLFRFCGPAGPISERLRHRHAGGVGTGGPRADRGGSRQYHRRRLAYLSDSPRPDPGRAPRERQDRGIRHLVLLWRVRDRRRHPGVSAARGGFATGLRQGGPRKHP